MKVFWLFLLVDSVFLMPDKWGIFEKRMYEVNICKKKNSIEKLLNQQKHFISKLLPLSLPQYILESFQYHPRGFFILFFHSVTTSNDQSATVSEKAMTVVIMRD